MPAIHTMKCQVWH